MECRDNIETFAKYIKTKDEHALSDASVRPFPTRQEKPYIWHTLDTYNREGIVAVEKSRQLMLTWLSCLYFLWVAKFQNNRLLFIQSKKEEDAANLVFNSEWTTARISFMEYYLPEELKSDIAPSYGKLIFRDTGSRIWGIPEGGDQIRSYTPSMVFSDEFAYQPEAEAAWQASAPAVRGGGKFIACSSAKNGAFMKQLIKRSSNDTLQEVMEGISSYTADSGFHVLRIHYSADPEKNPAYPDGAIWYAESQKGYIGGIESSAWRREMEIDWDAAGGDLVFPHFLRYKNKIVIAPFDVPETWHLYGAFDYGHRNPSSFHVYAIDHDGDIYSVWEYYRAGVGYRAIAREIRACPLFDRLRMQPVADPSLWAKTQQTEDGNDVKSVAQLFLELPENEQIFFVPGKSGGDITVAEKINGFLWNEEDLKAGKQPRFKIFKTCPMQVWELEKLRYEDWSAVVQEKKNKQEGIVDKDNHSYDDLKYFLMMFFFAPNAPKPIDLKMEALKYHDPASYHEWKSVEKRLNDTPSNTNIFGD